MNWKKIFTIFITLVCSVSLIALSFWYVNKKKSTKEQETRDPDAALTQKLDVVRGILPDDHVLGNPEASIVFYVYSDFSCPYCKQYHDTLRTLFKIYGDSGEIAYVFRHLPYVQIHPNSPMYALASECVAEGSGERAFWMFADDLFERVDPVRPLGAEELVEMASTVGVDRQQFVSCMRANTRMADVQADFDEAELVGADGTPFTVIETPERRSVYIGAQSFKTLAYVLKVTLGPALEQNNDVLTPEDFGNLSENASSTATSTATTTSNASHATTSDSESIRNGVIPE